MINNKYFDLFKVIAQGAANTAEKVMNNYQDEAESEKMFNAKKMRDHYLDVMQKADKKEELSLNDYQNLYLASLIMMNGIKKNLDTYTEVYNNYKNFLVPALEEISTSQDWEKTVNEKFKDE